MKKTVILLTFIGINALSASTVNIEKNTTHSLIDLLIKHDVLVEREIPQSRTMRISREARKSRIARIGRNSRGVRLQRTVRMVYKAPKKVKSSTSATTLIKKNYLSKLSK